MKSSVLASPCKPMPYSLYIVVGFLYVTVKIIFVLLGLLDTGAIFHGLIPTALTVTGGLLAFNEIKRRTVSIWHVILIILPMLSFVITPVYMYLKEQDMWLTNGRLEVLIIYEMLAVVQFIISLICRQRNRKTSVEQ